MPAVNTVTLTDDLAANQVYTRSDVKTANGETKITLANPVVGGEFHVAKIMSCTSRQLSDQATRNKVKFDFPFLHNPANSEGFGGASLEHELFSMEGRMNPLMPSADRDDHIARVQSFVASADFVALMKNEGIW